VEPTVLVQLGAGAATVAVLLGGMKWLSTQYVAMQARLDENAKACQQREAALMQRIQTLEDSRNTEAVHVIVAATEALKSSAAATQSCADALQANARAFERLTEESGQHRTR
jgi:hypothetical protein